MKTILFQKNNITSLSLYDNHSFTSCEIAKPLFDQNQQNPLLVSLQFNYGFLSPPLFSEQLEFLFHKIVILDALPSCLIKIKLFGYSGSSFSQLVNTTTLALIAAGIPLKIVPVALQFSSYLATDSTSEIENRQQFPVILQHDDQFTDLILVKSISQQEFEITPSGQIVDKQLSSTEQTCFKYSNNKIDENCKFVGLQVKAMLREFKHIIEQM